MSLDRFCSIYEPSIEHPNYLFEEYEKSVREMRSWVRENAPEALHPDNLSTLFEFKTDEEVTLFIFAFGIRVQWRGVGRDDFP